MATAKHQELERLRPQEQGLMEVAKNLPEGTVQYSQSGVLMVNLANPELAKRAIVLAPATTMARADLNFTPALSLVYINPDPDAGDVYPQEKDQKGKPKTLSLTKVGLRKLGDKAGIEQLPPTITYPGGVLTVTSGLRARRPDGTFTYFYESQNWVEKDEYEAVQTECPNQWGRGDDAHKLTPQEKETWIKKRWAQVKKSNLRMTESKAYNASYREALPGLKQKYTPDEFWYTDAEGNRQLKPFLVVATAFTPDYSDPRVLSMVMGQGQEAANMLFGAGGNGRKLAAATETEEEVTPEEVDPGALRCDEDGVVIDGHATEEDDDTAAEPERKTHGEKPTEDPRIPKGQFEGDMLSKIARTNPDYTKKTFKGSEKWGPVEEQWRRYWHGEENYDDITF